MNWEQKMSSCFNDSDYLSTCMKRAAEVLTDMARDWDNRAMPAVSPALNILRDEALEIAIAHGFKDATVGEDFMLMVTEIAEAMEDHRRGVRPNETWHDAPDGAPTPIPDRRFKPCGIPSEMADVIIRVLHFCGKHGIDIDRAVREKMAYNRTRTFKHGKTI